MLTDSLRQKFIYDVKPDENEMPDVKEDSDIDASSIKTYHTKLTSLCDLNDHDFEHLVAQIQYKYDSVLIQNDISFQNRNVILDNALKCYLYSFVFIFKKIGFKCATI